jgi:hypothetical protein
MKYKANPVIVDAFRIVKVGKPNPDTTVDLGLDNDENVVATSAMMSRMAPKLGDYWVIQSDGYIYLNPANVFEKKYSPIPVRRMPTAEELAKIEAHAQGAPITIHKDGIVTVGEKLVPVVES